MEPSHGFWGNWQGKASQLKQGSPLSACYFVVAGRAKPYPKVILERQENLFGESGECELHSPRILEKQLLVCFSITNKSETL